jgi:hypothetical protein
LSQKLPSAGGKSMFVSMVTFCLSVHIMAVKLLLTLVFVTPLQFHFLSKVLRHPFSIWPNSPITGYCLST